MRELELLHVFSSTSNDTSVTLKERERTRKRERKESNHLRRILLFLGAL